MSFLSGRPLFRCYVKYIFYWKVPGKFVEMFSNFLFQRFNGMSLVPQPFWSGRKSEGHDPRDIYINNGAVTVDGTEIRPLLHQKSQISINWPVFLYVDQQQYYVSTNNQFKGSDLYRLQFLAWRRQVWWLHILLKSFLLSDWTITTTSMSTRSFYGHHVFVGLKGAARDTLIAIASSHGKLLISIWCTSSCRISGGGRDVGLVSTVILFRVVCCCGCPIGS